MGNRRRGGRYILNVGPYGIGFPGAMVHDLLEGDPMLESPSSPRLPEIMECQFRCKVHGRKACEVFASNRVGEGDQTMRPGNPKDRVISGARLSLQKCIQGGYRAK